MFVRDKQKFARREFQTNMQRAVTQCCSPSRSFAYPHVRALSINICLLCCIFSTRTSRNPVPLHACIPSSFRFPSSSVPDPHCIPARILTIPVFRVSYILILFFIFTPPLAVLCSSLHPSITASPHCPLLHCPPCPLPGSPPAARCKTWIVIPYPRRPVVIPIPSLRIYRTSPMLPYHPSPCVTRSSTAFLLRCRSCSLLTRGRTGVRAAAACYPFLLVVGRDVEAKRPA
ncbi:hypothetical protein L227DRAFT_225125 [Lentinus tigrinus ALCF2SS1-6]|uniref:Uncharacterized protein n=1 Tax=Lentinus tigrinus ALCF2SS1-6 TaxID=1328759 RepID=A0A5C2S3U0_9APHY|nr:hypothetical protein L227DRAFT_225125 [Lentinus tigrinus ALCF2SS1-6]